ncbi:SDR family NAD(P)-dependent oxidoreductase [Aliikangiella sp. IMCC44359]|uniref:SDR family NAD(P)-dependent oxidoreductase n=1 Tax=Aliikangiella sp. IMCC44359 TaxID=3459125 RepID=UPI00403AFC1B
MTQQNNDIAVIGIGCRFPGANRGDVFYQNLIDNIDSVKEVPSNRWDAQTLYSEKKQANRLSSMWGGFISDVDKFDSRFFKIIPSEAEQIDPQQKLFLTTSWEALENAGYASQKKLTHKKVGVYAGVTWNEFSLLANEYGYIQDKYKGAGSLYWGIPNRVSYFFDFKGPSLAIDTACSSSLVAVDLASKSLLSGESDMVLAGGVNLNLHPAKYLFLSSANFLSSEGKCRGFGEGGDGYVPSEGVAVLVLKRLADAVSDGDRIHGIIKGIATNHGGKATGYTVPNPMAHKELIQTAMQRANIIPQDVSYVECHGTGTDLGDPIEVAGLRQAFEASTKEKQFCGIGTVKSNIGHCEATAGIAGLIKVLYSMKKQTLPATLHVDTPNKKIKFENTPFYLVDKNKLWSNGEKTLIAGLSSFGAGGSNCHCILESYRSDDKKRVVSKTQSFSLPISSHNEERTKAYCKELYQFLSRIENNDLSDIAYTLMQKEEFEHKVVFIVENKSQLTSLLSHYVESESIDNVLVSNEINSTFSHKDSLVEQASRWINNNVSIETLNNFESARVVDLPTYCFEPKRSWIHDENILYQKPVMSSQAGANKKRLHPLIDNNTSTLSKGIFNKILYRTEYYVDEHWIQNYPVLPGVCLVEMARSSACLYLESDSIEIFDVWFLEPVNLRDNDSIALEVNLFQQANEFRFEIFSNKKTVKHVTGKIRFIDAMQKNIASISISTINQQCERTLTTDEVYANFAQTKIVQKGRFKVIEEYRFNPKQAIAKLVLSNQFDNQDEYGINPTLLDGAVQTAMTHLFLINGMQGTVLPFQVGSCIKYRAMTSIVHVLATLKNADSKKYDIIVCDEKGNMLAQINGFVLRVFHDKTIENNLFLFSQSLNELPALKSSHSIKPGRPASILLPLSGQYSDVDMPQYWRRIVWDRMAQESSEYIQDEPKKQLLSWLNSSVHATPRIVLMIDEGSADQCINDVYSHIKSQAYRLFELGKFLVLNNRVAEVIACVVGEHGIAKALTSATLALFKSYNLEISKFRFRVISVSPEQLLQPIENLILSEAEDLGTESLITYQQGKRYSLVNKLVTQDFAKPTEKQTWLITGAGGSLGQLVSQHLLNNGHKIVMVGRSPQSDSHRKNFNHYTDQQCAYFQVDLTNLLETKETIEKIITKFGDSFGVIHCAGRVSDAALINKEWTSFESVLDAKVKTLLNLCESLSNYNVNRIVLFSSITALMGNRGQTDYAFANGLLDSIKPLINKMMSSSPVVCGVNWPYWESGGMKVTDENLNGYINHFMSYPLPSSKGLELFDSLLVNGSRFCAALFSNTSLDVLNTKMALKPMPILTSASEPLPIKESDNSNLNAEDEASKKSEIKNYLFWIFDHYLKLELTDDDLELELSELGLDSIAQMDLITHIEKENRFNDISQTLLLDYPTLSNLINFFYDHHRKADYSVQES